MLPSKEEAAAAQDVREEISLDRLNSILNSETLNTLKILLSGSRYGRQIDWQVMDKNRKDNENYGNAIFTINSH